VRGFGMAVTWTPCVSQWAEIQRMALGKGMVFASSIHPLVNSLFSRAFIGLPWPIKRTGINSEFISTSQIGNCNIYIINHKLIERKIEGKPNSF
jgi:hypothetical protein